MDKTRFQGLYERTIEILSVFWCIDTILMYRQHHIRKMYENTIDIVSLFIPVHVVFKLKRA